ncbi:rhomboid family intramembrane serine protease [Pseudolactococcus plantarum]|uniref:GlpG protein (Membrane protein of glp regulon) n=1 Tax=Pseudolactococcus plantarum TaxID=1365 RepID=A0A2A5S4B9_9LACT|nr:rhomboid family intramembrane serine protease [Lactococcus plantarum]MDN6069875.1 rhomboid family intramembrane serine protease [Lactococcus plantarum]MDN6085190.1 rhomboid family intramembrane serine protease [Lactococcus plantarum]PCS08314.1 GlpG protein (membrane protein of glp regulon) [Lactococcus plantarum]
MNKLTNFRNEFNRYPTTYILATITFGVWMTQLLRYGAHSQNPINLFHSGALFGPDIIAHPIHLWRLVTPIFVHIGWEHFLLNFFTLVFIGRQIEGAFGSQRFFMIYLLSGIYGNIVIFFLEPFSLSAGASTSLFGVFSAMAMIGYLTKNSSFLEIGKQFAVLVLANLVINLFQTDVSISGHIGGAIGGILLAAPFAPRIVAHRISKIRKIIFFTIFIVSAVLLIWFGLHHSFNTLY